MLSLLCKLNLKQKTKQNKKQKQLYNVSSNLTFYFILLLSSTRHRWRPTSQSRITVVNDEIQPSTNQKISKQAKLNKKEEAHNKVGDVRRQPTVFLQNKNALNKWAPPIAGRCVGFSPGVKLYLLVQGFSFGRRSQSTRKINHRKEH